MLKISELNRFALSGRRFSRISPRLTFPVLKPPSLIEITSNLNWSLKLPENYQNHLPENYQNITRITRKLPELPESLCNFAIKIFDTKIATRPPQDKSYVLRMVSKIFRGML